jgi:fructose-bisphosphate aldolase class II
MSLPSNRAIQMLNAAAAGHYGVLGVVAYNMEAVVASIQAAETKRSPLQILLFPWALQYSTILVDFVAAAARKATVPITVHLDHAQDAEVIKRAANLKAADGTPAFDSIMVDMSRFEKEVVLS